MWLNNGHLACEWLNEDFNQVCLTLISHSLLDIPNEENSVLFFAVSSSLSGAGLITWYLSKKINIFKKASELLTHAQNNEQA